MRWGSAPTSSGGDRRGARDDASVTVVRGVAGHDGGSGGEHVERTEQVDLDHAPEVLGGQRSPLAQEAAGCRDSGAVDRRTHRPTTGRIREGLPTRPSASSPSRRGCSTPRCCRDCRRGHAPNWAPPYRIRPVSAHRTNTRPSSPTSSTTRCSTARSSASTAPCACPRAQSPYRQSPLTRAPCRERRPEREHAWHTPYNIPRRKRHWPIRPYNGSIHQGG